MCSGSEPPPRPSLRSAIRNLREGDRSLAERVRLVIRNQLRRVETHQGCCGNYGEPGC
jgi:hypothetical protein